MDMLVKISTLFQKNFYLKLLKKTKVLQERNVLTLTIIEFLIDKPETFSEINLISSLLHSEKTFTVTQKDLPLIESESDVEP